MRKLLVANRGEIARRVMRTAREMGIATVAVFSDPDEASLFAGEADQAVHLPGAAPADTYLNVARLVDAAVRTGADAVHPGYGFLSENAGFARACEEAGLIFVGPSPAVIEAMGSKVEAKRLMEKAGVPVLPGFTVDGSRAGMDAAAAAIGYPVLVKAAYGGGGRGMRVVRDPGRLAEAIAAAEREAAAAFGDGTVFVERYLEAPRHVEVQVFGDSHGNVIHLFERECSIQRRHQKVIEEAPAPAVDRALRKEICDAAVTAARAVGYVGAGTVEFVLDADGRFYFLEVNTRLQVEHPVTEMITGLDLVRLQLEVAGGERLPAAALEATMTGHAIEARLYAEDVPAGFLPVSGRLHRLEFPMVAGLRVDAGYGSGSTVSTHYDAMVAKVVAWAPERTDAAAKLADCLARATIHGLATNRALLVRTLTSADFVAGRTDTAFYDRHDPAELGRPWYQADAPRLHAAAAAIHRIVMSARSGPLPPTIPAGWRNVGEGTPPLRFEVDGGTVEGPGRLEDLEPGIRLVSVDEGSVILDHDGLRRRYLLERAGPDWYVDSDLGSTHLVEVDRFPQPQSGLASGALVAPLPGTVVAVLTSPGSRVEAGQIIATLEAMKMEHPVRAPGAGTVQEVRVSPGDQVDLGQVIAVVDDD